MIPGLSISVVITFCHLSCWDGLAKSTIGGRINVGQKTIARFEEDMRLTELSSDILGWKGGKGACAHMCAHVHVCVHVCVIDTANYSNWYTYEESKLTTHTDVSSMSTKTTTGAQTKQVWLCSTSVMYVAAQVCTRLYLCVHPLVSTIVYMC